ncbi:MAG: acetyl-CoA decarbonylase/synthase complex subunit delta [Chloroflexi bacterium]|nr:acetyl-CoA decarbonylase/synthase complex subunit delta [Chloroflexota bacterium]MBU1749811.1 acetyl-CoA decarbonylase/synthase complex subunit delta [Chloroflexota bacterium]MBU1878722.1 acetyl-CoA decarbonylase/synthase complex subunit delta [Chloroflexota bacterium]
MPTVEIPVEKNKGKVREVTLGATAADGGTRAYTITVGGETALPFLHFEGEIPHRPVVAVEILDKRPTDWSPLLLQAWGDVVDDPVAWAKSAVDAGADLIQITLASTHPDADNTSPADAAALVKKVLEAVDVPLIVKGPGQPDKDNDVLVAVAEAAKGERVALGLCEDKNYRTIVAAALAHGHVVIGSSPIDVNLAKQVNILISDVGLGLDRVLMDPTTGALGYGLEYTYSVMERLRLAALMGDSMTQQPLICFVGHEAWRAKESKVGEGVPAAWGDWEQRARTWEIVTATSLLQSGADILVLRHPESVKVIKRTIDKLMK